MYISGNLRASNRSLTLRLYVRLLTALALRGRCLIHEGCDSPGRVEFSPWIGFSVRYRSGRSTPSLLCRISGGFHRSSSRLGPGNSGWSIVARLSQTLHAFMCLNQGVESLSRLLMPHKKLKHKDHRSSPKKVCQFLTVAMSTLHELCMNKEK